MRFRDFSPMVLARLRPVEVAAVKVGCLFYLEESNRTIPIEEATLQRSGDTDVEERGTRVVGAVGYNTAYARRQHEETTWRHDPGRRSKWLELTGVEQQDAIAAVVGTQIRTGMGGV